MAFRVNQLASDGDYSFWGENAIAAFSFAGLTFPGGEMPARLICRPYCCGKAPPEVYPHSKSRQERSINGTTGTVGPWVLSTYWYRRSIGTIDGGCHYKKLSTLEIHI